MNTCFFILGFIGTFFWYNTSEKARLSTTGSMEKWLQAHPREAKWTATFCLLLSAIGLVWIDGLGAGLIKAFLLLMLALTLIVALAPFFLLKWKHVVVLIIISFLLECLIF